jgi:site-specific recombinase XerD
MASLHAKKLPENVRQRGKNYYFRFRDQEGKQKETPLGPDLSVAKGIAKKLASRLVDIRAGTANPREAAWADAERKPLTDHVHDWHAYLTSKGDVAKHADQSRDRVLRLIESAKVLRISGLTISGVQIALADLRLIKGRKGRKQLSDCSVAHHARAIKSFSRWLWRDGRVREDALVHMGLPEVNDSIARRALEAEQAAALIAKTPTERTRASMTGPDRAILYATAVGTGLRINELLSLTPESFDLDADPPSVTCLGENTKNGRLAIQPIRPELAEMLRPWLAGKPPGKPVFAMRIDAAAMVLRRDLEAAGVDSAAEYDFHCLRHTYVTLLIKSGASVKVCQELARHADPKLTLSLYTHLTVHDVARGLEGLSHTLPTTGVSMGLTGTDGQVAISSPGRSQVDPARQSAKMIAPKATSRDQYTDIPGARRRFRTVTDLWRLGL